jgi:hypothetical protein
MIITPRISITVHNISINIDGNTNNKEPTMTKVRKGEKKQNIIQKRQCHDSPLTGVVDVPIKISGICSCR